MPEDRFDLREIARAVLNDLPQDQRLALMTDMMVEAGGARGLEQLSKARAAISLRMQEMIDDKFPPWSLELMILDQERFGSATGGAE